MKAKTFICTNCTSSQRSNFGFPDTRPCIYEWEDYLEFIPEALNGF